VYFVPVTKVVGVRFSCAASLARAQSLLGVSGIVPQDGDTRPVVNPTMVMCTDTPVGQGFVLQRETLTR
jgi:hypothetical protein